MSGHKYSRVEIERRRRIYKEAVLRLKNLEASLSSSRERIRGLLKEIPHGVKASFPQDIRRAEAWLRKGIPKVNDNMRISAFQEVENLQESTKKVQEVAKKAEALLEEGRGVLQKLVEVKEIRRGEKERELFARVELMKDKFASMKEPFDTWRPGECDRCLSELSDLHEEILAGEFPRVERSLNVLEQKHAKLSSEARSLELQDEQRRFVLSALEEVCREMGWDVENEPKLEEEGNPKSALTFTVNTYSNGLMTFRLTLEGIHVDSPFATENRFCYRQFDDFSEKLKNFGINTKFERVGGEELPEGEHSAALSPEIEGEMGMER